jgi:hypothetical protein
LLPWPLTSGAICGRHEGSRRWRPFLIDGVSAPLRSTGRVPLMMPVAIIAWCSRCGTCTSSRWPSGWAG